VSGENTGVAPDGGVGVASGAGTSALATRADKTAAPARLAPLRNLRRPGATPRAPRRSSLAPAGIVKLSDVSEAKSGDVLVFRMRDRGVQEGLCVAVGDMSLSELIAELPIVLGGLGLAALGAKVDHAAVTASTTGKSAKSK